MTDRFARKPITLTALDDAQREALLWVAKAGLISLPQLVRLFPSWHPKKTERTLQTLFNGGAVKKIRVATVRYNFPNVYQLEGKGRRLLQELGYAPPPYKRTSSTLVPHELMARDLLCYAVEGVRRYRWHAPSFRCTDLAVGPTLPDAVIIIPTDTADLVGLVESDTGTERSTRPDEDWGKKCGEYAALFASGAIADVLGYDTARVLVIVPSLARLNFVRSQILAHDPANARKYWLVEQEMLTRDFKEAVWVRGEHPRRRDLLTPDEELQKREQRLQTRA